MSYHLQRNKEYKLVTLLQNLIFLLNIVGWVEEMHKIQQLGLYRPIIN